MTVPSTKQNLFHIQDDDRSIFVIARDWQHALEKWQALIKQENEWEEGQDEPQPRGISLIAEKNEIIL